MPLAPNGRRNKLAELGGGTRRPALLRLPLRLGGPFFRPCDIRSPVRERETWATRHARHGASCIGRLARRSLSDCRGAGNACGAGENNRLSSGALAQAAFQAGHRHRHQRAVPGLPSGDSDGQGAGSLARGAQSRERRSLVSDARHLYRPAGNLPRAAFDHAIRQAGDEPQLHVLPSGRRSARESAWIACGRAGTGRVHASAGGVHLAENGQSFRDLP